MMVVLPVLLYPMIIMGFGKLQESTREATEGRQSRVAVWGGAPAGLHDALTHEGKLQLEPWANAPRDVQDGLERGTLTRPPLSTKTDAGGAGAPRRSGGLGGGAVESASPVLDAARKAIVDRRVDAVLVVWPDVASAVADGRAGRVSIYFDSVREDSAEAQRRVFDRLPPVAGARTTAPARSRRGFRGRARPAIDQCRAREPSNRTASRPHPALHAGDDVAARRLLSGH